MKHSLKWYAREAKAFLVLAAGVAAFWVGAALFVGGAICIGALIR